MAVALHQTILSHRFRSAFACLRICTIKYAPKRTHCNSARTWQKHAGLVFLFSIVKYIRVRHVHTCCTNDEHQPTIRSNGTNVAQRSSAPAYWPSIWRVCLHRTNDDEHENATEAAALELTFANAGLAWPPVHILRMEGERRNANGRQTNQRRVGRMQMENVSKIVIE